MARPERAAGGVGGLGACQSAVLSAGMPIGVPCLPLSVKQELRDLLQLPGRDLTLVKCFVNLKDSHFLSIRNSQTLLKIGQFLLAEVKPSSD